MISMFFLEIPRYNPNSVDPDQTPRSVASDLDLHGLPLSLLWTLGVVGCGECVVYLSHQDVQLILAYSWARPAILVASKDREGMFLFILFLHFHFCSSFFPVPLFHLYYLFCLFSPFLLETTQNDPQGLTCR